MQWQLYANLAESAGDSRVEVDVSAGDTVRDALEALYDAKPAIRDEVADGDGALAGHVNVLHKGTALGDGELDRELDGGDELALLPPVSGG